MTADHSHAGRTNAGLDSGRWSQAYKGDSRPYLPFDLGAPQPAVSPIVMRGRRRPSAPQSSDQPPFLEVWHIAHRLSVSEEFVRRLLRGKKLAAIRLGNRWRVDPIDLAAFIDAQRHASDSTRK